MTLSCIVSHTRIYFLYSKFRKSKQQNTISQSFGDLRLSSAIAIGQHWYFELNPALRPIQINGILLPKLFSPTVRKNGFSDQEKLLKFEAEG